MAIAVGSGLLACGDPPSAAVPRVAGTPTEQAWTHAIAFERGVTIGEVHTPDLVEPGQSWAVSWRMQGPTQGLLARVVAEPPRAGARQVALGGVGAPPPQVPADPRAVTIDVPLSTGEGAATITLPTPWHPAQVLLTLELLDGDERIAAIDGPRRHDGVAQLALVDVAARPTAIVAVPISSVQLDGRLDEPAWSTAVAHPMVHSLDGEPYLDRPSSVRFGWDAEHLYVAAEIEDPDVWSEYTRRDDPLWNQEVFELFVFGDDRRRDYLELQVSPRGTVFDARFGSYRKGDQAWNGSWRAAVDLRGSIDQRRDRDEGWSVEMAIPWTEICTHTEVTCPVTSGTELRVNAFRFERPRGGAAVGLAVSPPRVPDFHAPENAAVLKLGAS